MIVPLLPGMSHHHRIGPKKGLTCCSFSFLVLCVFVQIFLHFKLCWFSYGLNFVFILFLNGWSLLFLKKMIDKPEEPLTQRTAFLSLPYKYCCHEERSLEEGNSYECFWASDESNGSSYQVLGQLSKLPSFLQILWENGSVLTVYLYEGYDFDAGWQTKGKTNHCTERVYAVQPIPHALGCFKQLQDQLNKKVENVLSFAASRVWIRNIKFGIQIQKHS